MPLENRTHTFWRDKHAEYWIARRNISDDTLLQMYTLILLIFKFLIDWRYENEENN